MTYLTNIFNSIKAALLAILAGAVAILGILFWWYKRKADIDDALLKEEKMNEKLQKEDNQIAENNKALAAEEQKRKEIENEKTPTSNVVDFFNRKQ